MMWSWLIKFEPNSSSMIVMIVDIVISMRKARAMTTILMSTVKSISSCSLYSMHCFQIWNWRLDYLPLPASPNVVIFVSSLSLILLISAVSIIMNELKVWLKLNAEESTEYFPSFTRFRTSTITGLLRRLSIFISSMKSSESFLSVIWKIGSLIKL